MLAAWAQGVAAGAERSEQANVSLAARPRSRWDRAHMPAKKRLPYGTWPSPISAAAAAKASRRFGMVQAAGGAVYWSESRPEQGGRQAILRADAGGAVEGLLPGPLS